MPRSRSFLAVLGSSFTALALMLGLTLAAAPAMAHAGLTSSNPEEGAILKELPSEIVLEFTEEIGTPAFVAVTDPDNRRLDDGDPEIDGATVRQRIDPATHAGLHTIAYRVVSADGHPVTGHVRVTVEFPDDGSDGSTGVDSEPAVETSADAASDEASEETETDTEGTSSTTLVAGGVIGLLVALLLGVLALSKRGRR